MNEIVELLKDLELFELATAWESAVCDGNKEM